MCKLVIGSRSLTYEAKLKKFNLLSLRARRIKQQLVFMYKMKNKIIDLPFEDFFVDNDYKKTRGNAFRLRIPHSKTINTAIIFLHSLQ